MKSFIEQAVETQQYMNHVLKSAVEGIVGPDFHAFPKITRFYEQDVVITEKIDGTNALVWVSDHAEVSERIVKAGSRSRWITPEDDNYGFARWVKENEDELKQLGPGYHYGEWWGQGIQRKYGMDRKVFSLFNTHRWGESRPACCDVVPVLYQGLVRDIPDCWPSHSVAAKKYGVLDAKAEGTMLYFTKAGLYFKHPYNK